MTESTRLASQQLVRMREMNRFYHERFFSDVRFTTLTLIALFVLGASQSQIAYLLVPPAALLGAAQTAFDASYLIFSRHYATDLERYLNRALGERILVAHEMEDRYLFPLNSPKIVTLTTTRDFSWFGFMTILYTAMGVAAFVFGLALGWHELFAHGPGWAVAYLGTMALLTVAALGVGWWWFPAGTGEERLKAALVGLGQPPDET